MKNSYKAYLICGRRMETLSAQFWRDSNTMYEPSHSTQQAALTFDLFDVSSTDPGNDRSAWASRRSF